jgi:hypothetical protein
MEGGDIPTTPLLDATVGSGPESGVKPTSQGEPPLAWNHHLGTQFSPPLAHYPNEFSIIEGSTLGISSSSHHSLPQSSFIDSYHETSSPFNPSCSPLERWLLEEDRREQFVAAYAHNTAPFPYVHCEKVFPRASYLKCVHLSPLHISY